MAQAKSISKRKNKRKVRTEVSSPSSSGSDADKTSSAPSKRNKNEDTTSTNVEAPEHDHNTSNSGTSTDPPVFTKRTILANPEQAFEDFYLRQVTKEFANDLDKLRAANDFHGTGSIALLVGALRQGTACFGTEERVGVGGACAGAGA